MARTMREAVHPDSTSHGNQQLHVHVMYHLAAQASAIRQLPFGCHWLDAAREMLLLEDCCARKANAQGLPGIHCSGSSRLQAG